MYVNGLALECRFTETMVTALLPPARTRHTVTQWQGEKKSINNANNAVFTVVATEQGELHIEVQ